MNPGKTNAGAASGTAQLMRWLLAMNPLYGILPQEMIGRPRDFFVYGGAQLNIAIAGGQAADSLQIQNDSDFLIMAAVVEVRNHATAAVVASPNILAQIQDTGSGRSLFGSAGSADASRGQPLDNVYGTGQLPCYWTWPKLIKRASTVTTTFTNLDTAIAADVRYSYLGFKLFPNPAV